MNTANINDTNFINSKIYQQFLEQNPGNGSLNIRAFAARGAIPISGLKIVVSKMIENTNVIFFEGYTNESGIIERIILPTPKLVSNNLDIPNKTTYDIIASYNPDNFNKLYKVDMYENTCVVQTINVIPEMNFNNMGGII